MARPEMGHAVSIKKIFLGEMLFDDVAKAGTGSSFPVHNKMYHAESSMTCPCVV